ncbi:hypothetical protein TMU01_20670 [Tenuibacillus multivorans]|nr:hypothetical protein TMU01_20670 [Tenuibacillus multivorans]
MGQCIKLSRDEMYKRLVKEFRTKLKRELTEQERSFLSSMAEQSQNK